MNRNKGIEWDLNADSDGEQSQLKFLLSGKGAGWQKAIAVICLSLSVASAMLVLMNGLFGGMEAWIRRSAFLAGGCIFVILMYPLGRKSWRDDLNIWFVVDMLIILGIILAELYIILTYKQIASPYRVNGPLFTACGGFLILAVLEATRRCLSPVVVLVPAFFLVHAVFGNYFPGILASPGVSWAQLIDITVNIDTLFGIALEVIAGTLGLFLLFGAIVTHTRVSAFFISLANAIAGHRVGGPAKVSVISSGFLATISGTAVGNVATTGVVTIPLMKNIGYSPEVAGGIEACASNGGHVTPPVMGLVGFLIAGTIGMGYGELCLRAVIPAVLYFFSVYLAVDLQARKLGLAKLEKDAMPEVMPVLRQGGILLLPILGIIVMLGLDFSPGMAALVGLLTAAAVSFVKKETRLNPVKVLAILEQFMTSAAPLIVACGMIGIILGALFTSGLGSSFASNIYELAGGAVLPTLLGVAFASLLLGMGMPVVAVYIVIATLIIPALTRLGGVEPLQAHLFVFYYAAASGVTPPVCLVAFAAASIARAHPMKTGYQAFIIGFAKHLIPILFFLKAGLLLYGSPTQIVLAIVTAVLAILCMTTALQRYVIAPTRWYEALALGVATCLLLPDDIRFNALGAALAIVVLVRQALVGKGLWALLNRS